jgi:hypothetical protein
LLAETHRAIGNRGIVVDCAKCGAELAETAEYCHRCGVQVADSSAQEQQLVDLRRQLVELQQKVGEHADLIDQHADIVDGHASDIAGIESLLNSSDVYHDRFWPRAWAIYGHVLVPGLILGVVVYVAMFVIFGLRVTGR